MRPYNSPHEVWCQNRIHVEVITLNGLSIALETKSFAMRAYSCGLTHTHTHTQICSHAHTHTHTQRDARMHTHTHTHTQICTQAHKHRHTHKDVHTRTHRGTQAYTRQCTIHSDIQIKTYA